MRIDIISDTVCPWCFIGKRRLERALGQRPGLELEIAWRPFQLNPDMPREGMERETYLAAKFGGERRAQEIYAAIRDAGGEAGVDFAFESIERTPNTVDSHRLIHWAGAAGHQDAVVELLFRRYFQDGADIGEREVLVGLAAEAGMDPNTVRVRLAEGQDIELIKAQDLHARRMGVSGVPHFVIGDTETVVGAQAPAAFLQIFDRLARASAGTVAGDA